MSSRHRWHPVAQPPEGLIAPSRLDATGDSGPTKKQAESPYWIRTSHGLYVPSHAPRHLAEQRILEQAARLPSHGAVTGWAACRLWGANFFDGLGRDGSTLLRVPLNVGPQGHLASSPWSYPVHHTLLPQDRAWRYGIPTVSPERAAYDAIRFARDTRSRLVAADMVAAGEVTSLALVAAYAAEQPQHRTLVLRTLARASEHSRSTRETEMRDIAAREAGLTDLLVNPAIYDLEGRLLGIVDLLDATAGMVMELQGADHRSSVRHSADLRRSDGLTRVGLVVCEVVGFETSSPKLVADRMRQVRRTALFLPETERKWVAVPPADTLHERIVRRRAQDERSGPSAG